MAPAALREVKPLSGVPRAWGEAKPGWQGGQAPATGGEKGGELGGQTPSGREK